VEPICRNLGAKIHLYFGYLLFPRRFNAAGESVPNLRIAERKKGSVIWNRSLPGQPPLAPVDSVDSPNWIEFGNTYSFLKYWNLKKCAASSHKYLMSSQSAKYGACLSESNPPEAQCSKQFPFLDTMLKLPLKLTKANLIETKNTNKNWI